MTQVVVGSLLAWWRYIDPSIALHRKKESSSSEADQCVTFGNRLKEFYLLSPMRWLKYSLFSDSGLLKALDQIVHSTRSARSHLEVVLFVL